MNQFTHSTIRISSIRIVWMNQFTHSTIRISSIRIVWMSQFTHSTIRISSIRIVWMNQFTHNTIRISSIRIVWMSQFTRVNPKSTCYLINQSYFTVFWRSHGIEKLRSVCRSCRQMICSSRGELKRADNNHEVNAAEAPVRAMGR